MRLLIAIASLCAISLIARAQPKHATHDHTAPSAPSKSLQLDPSEPVNAMCPVMTDEEIDPRFTVQYKGMTIGLCCRKCMTKFNKDPEQYLANITALAPGSLTIEPDEAPGSIPVSLADDDPADHDHAGHDHAGEDGSGTDPIDTAPIHADDPISHEHEPDHDHTRDHDESSQLLAWLGKFHPPLTHLPIGLVLGALIAEFGLVLTRKELFRNAANFCIVVAALGALGAATLGWFNGGLALVDDDWVQTTHRWLGTSTAILSVLTCLVLARTVLRASAEHPPPRTALRVMLVITVIVVTATGFFGGSLIYGLNHYAW